MAIKHETMIINGILALDKEADLLEWQTFRDGIEIYPIYADEAGCSSALLKYAAGSSIPLHRHTGYEHILILSGSQSDEKQIYSKGDLVISAPGSSHSIQSEEGCIVLAIWEKPVAFL